MHLFGAWPIQTIQIPSQRKSQSRNYWICHATTACFWLTRHFGRVSNKQLSIWSSFLKYPWAMHYFIRNLSESWQVRRTGRVSASWKSCWDMYFSSLSQQSVVIQSIATQFHLSERPGSPTSKRICSSEDLIRSPVIVDRAVSCNNICIWDRCWLCQGWETPRPHKSSEV
jgi:hypothetical protein